MFNVTKGHLMTKLEALRESVAHWTRMIEWARTNTKLTVSDMYDILGEGPNSRYCALCQLYIVRHCELCPLDEIEERCSTTGSLFDLTVNYKHDLSQWVHYAERMLETLQQLTKKEEEYAALANTR